MLDFKKAFDLINIELLLTKLSCYGIRGLSLLWLTSYLTSRSQKTKVSSCLSESKPVCAGVPQGSILGPLLFIMFINDIFQYNANNIELYLYADDTGIIFHAESDVELQLIIDDFFTKFAAWCTANCIVVNTSKSHFLSFNDTNVTMSINGSFLDHLSVVKYLGVFIDNKLSWNAQVDNITKKCCQRIGLFKRVLPLFTNDVALLYYNAFIKSCFSYCLMFWCNNNRSGRYKLINKIDHLIARLAKYSGITVENYVFKFGICNVMSVYKLQCLQFMHDLHSNVFQLPYFSLASNKLFHKHNTRQSSNIHIAAVTSLDQRNFMYSCVLFWNNVPSLVKSLPRYAFIKNCKSSIFSK